MYTLFTFFIVSLAGIIFLIERKIRVLKRVDNLEEPGTFINLPRPEEIRYIALYNTKKYGYLVLVLTIRLYVLGAHASKNILRKLKRKAKFLFSKIFGEKVGEENKEVSKFLKSVSEYKQKISKIKQQIKKEEGLE